MKFSNLTPAFALIFLSFNANAQIYYSKIEAGSILQDGISLGVFSTPIPLPPGNWLVVNKRIDEVKLTGGNVNTAPKVVLTLKNTNLDNNIIYAILLSFTPDSISINWNNNKCESISTNTITDDLGKSPSDLIFVCAKAVPFSNFRSTLAQATTSTNNWRKLNLSPLSGMFEFFPDNVLLLDIAGNQFHGKNFTYSFIIKHESNLKSDRRYLDYIKSSIHTYGLTLMKFLSNENVKFPALAAYESKNNERDSPASKRQFPDATGDNRIKPTTTPGSKQTEERLTELKALFEKGLISQEQFDMKRTEIINSL